MPTVYSKCDECNDLSFIPNNLIMKITKGNYMHGNHLYIAQILKQKGLPEELCIKILLLVNECVKCDGINCKSMLCNYHSKVAYDNGNYYLRINNTMMCDSFCWNYIS